MSAEKWADRLMRQQKMTSDLYLRGEQPPTPRQVSAVLHALADHTFLMHLTGPEVAEMGSDRADLGTTWAQATGAGRLLQRMGDALDRREASA